MRRSACWPHSHFTLCEMMKKEMKNPPLMANITEVGRSIQTPNLGNEAPDTSKNRLYKDIFSPPRDYIQKLKNDTSLVLDFQIDMKLSDEVYAFTSYKLYREKKNWTDAELHCKLEGGQLASIHSQWEQAQAVREADMREKCSFF